MILNEIEKNLFTDVDKAIEYLVGDNKPFVEALKLTDPNIIIDRANNSYIYNNIWIYIDLYLKLLYMSGEEALVLSYDPSSMFMCKLKSCETIDQIPKDINLSNQMWLFVRHMKNNRLFNFIQYYFHSPNKNYVGNERSVWVNLCPITTTKPLDDLARAMCVYL